jgi:hypothetical protein
MKIRSTLAAITLAAAGASQAELVTYDFQDFWGDIFAPAAVPAHLQASRASVNNTWGSLCWNIGVGGANDFACGGFGSSTLSFTVSAAAGWQFDINSFVFQGVGPNSDGTAPSGYAVYSSLDGFLNPLISGSLVGQTPLQRYDYDAGLAAQGLTGPFELRLVSTGRDGLPASAWLLDNLRLDVTLTQVGSVPEPGSAALVALALLGLRAARRARG